MWLDTFTLMSAETQGFLIVILVFNLYFHIRFTPENAQKAPAFLTTLGILGTFVGIAIGLWYFDPNNVQKSVPSLIEGIKTAVWASAFGIFCALTVKFREILFGRSKSDSKRRVSATADDIADILISIDRSLAGDEEKSIVNQLKQNRSQQAEEMQALRQSLDGFYERMAEANVKALVGALSEVIRDFNVKLNDQFGDNFKQLNMACEKLLLWQKEYSSQIDAMIAQQQSTSRNMEEIGTRYSQMVGQAETFHHHASKMSELLSGIETQRHQMESSLVSLATLINSASSGLPDIERNIMEMTRQLANGNEAFNANMAQLIERTKEQVLILDAALSEELTKSLQSFGRQMASLSEKFADDYGPITERLQAILKIGK